MRSVASRVLSRSCCGLGAGALKRAARAGLSKGYTVYKYLVGAAAALLFVAYTFDIFQWHGGCWLVMKRLIYLLVVLACAIGALISFASYPYLPLALVLAILPLCASPRPPPPALLTQAATRSIKSLTRNVRCENAQGT